MFEGRVIAAVERVTIINGWISAFFQAAATPLSRTGAWATTVSQRFGSVVSALLGPAIVSVYVIALWSLTSNMGWTGTFMVTSGPLSNWIVWLGIALLLHGAASILKRHSGRS